MYYQVDMASTSLSQHWLVDMASTSLSQHWLVDMASTSLSQRWLSEVEASGILINRKSLTFLGFTPLGDYFSFISDER